MRQSQLFSKTRHEAPRDEVSKNAQFLIRAGFINKELAGAYSFLPLGLRVLNNIVHIIREEINAIGGQEIMMTALQDKKIWEATDRWDDRSVDNWFKTKLKNGNELGLGFTHEEPITQMLKDHVRSWRDIPFSVYQFQTKFRNEERAKSGIIRGREFLMKDLYSFNASKEEHEAFYEKVKKAYIRIFDRLGLGDSTYVTFASGGSFSKYSHEFQTLCPAGEDTIYVDEKKKIAINKEVMNDDVLKDLGLDGRELVEKRSVEVGNIFSLGTKFSQALGLNFKDRDGSLKPVVMGSYGIGPSRVMGTIAEIFAKDTGLLWPREVSPFKVHLIALYDDAGKVKDVADKLYDHLSNNGVEVLYDDREATAGEKFSDADLFGIGERYVVSSKTVEADTVEVKDLWTGKVEMKKIVEILKN